MLILAVLTAIPFLPPVFAPFSVVDDIQYIERNPYIKSLSGANIKAIFTKPYHHNYLPLHILNYAVDYSLWGERPGGYRIESILWHILCVFLVFFILRRLFDRDDVAVFGALNSV